ncbi:hypothetical protein MKT69_05515, partial [Leptospira borgpetersenii]
MRLSFSLHSKKLNAELSYGSLAGPSLFHGGLSQFRRISRIQAIVGDRECYASSSENDQSIERPVGS